MHFIMVLLIDCPISVESETAFGPPFQEARSHKHTKTCLPSDESFKGFPKIFDASDSSERPVGFVPLLGRFIDKL